jgi:hypothetical protein
MIEHRQFKTKLTVRFVKRDDGGLRAYCDAVPGFYLSGSDKRAVLDDVIPALEALVRSNFEINVTVSPLGYGIFQLLEWEQEEPSNAIEYTREYVVERLAA